MYTLIQKMEDRGLIKNTNMGISKEWVEWPKRVQANFENIRLEHAKNNAPVVVWDKEKERNVLLYIDGRIEEITERFPKRKNQ